MGSYGADGHAKGVGDLLVGALLLMIKDEDGSLDLAEALELLFDGLLELALFYLLFGVAVGVRRDGPPSRRYRRRGRCGCRGRGGGASTRPGRR